MDWPFQQTDIPDTPLEKVQMLQNMLVENATTGNMDERIYLLLRKEFMTNSSVKDLLPDFVRSNRTSGASRGHFQRISPQWQPRREYIWKSFGPLLDYLEGSNQAPADSSISQTLASLDKDSVTQACHKALERRDQDPEGAITAARTLLESICKLVIDGSGQFYNEKNDLPKLYHQASLILNLCPIPTYRRNIQKPFLVGANKWSTGLELSATRLGMPMDMEKTGQLDQVPDMRHWL